MKWRETSPRLTIEPSKRTNKQTTHYVRLVNQAPSEREKPIRKFFFTYGGCPKNSSNVHFTGADANYRCTKIKKMAMHTHNTQTQTRSYKSLNRFKNRINRAFLCERVNKTTPTTAIDAFIDLYAKMYRNPNTELEILPTIGEEEEGKKPDATCTHLNKEKKSKLVLLYIDGTSVCRLSFDFNCHVFFVSIKLDYIGHRARRCNCITVRPLFIEKINGKERITTTTTANDDDDDDDKTTLKALSSILM